MPAGYRKVRDNKSSLKYVKNHRNDDRTEVEATKQNGRWQLVAIDFNEGGNPMGLRTENTIGVASTKSEARQQLKNWMQRNPKGLLGGGGGLF